MIPSYPVRKSLHLNDYDYSRDGLYFITICTQNRSCLFGHILDNEMQLNDVGLMIENGWNNLPIRYPNLRLDTFVVMPNHIHGILKIDPCLVGESLADSRSKQKISRSSNTFRFISRVAIEIVLRQFMPRLCFAWAK